MNTDCLSNTQDQDFGEENGNVSSRHPAHQMTYFNMYCTPRVVVLMNELSTKLTKTCSQNVLTLEMMLNKQ